MNTNIPFHPLADIFPLMEGAEFDALVADIKAHGLREEIVLYDGMILDGRNRYRALLALGADIPGFHAPFCRPLGDVKMLSLVDPLAYVISANIHRRHLNAEQKRELIAKLIAAQPKKSDRLIAKTVKADHKTVGAVRKAKEATGEISPVDKRVGADGKARKQPARKAGTPKDSKVDAGTEARDLAAILVLLDRRVAQNLYEFLWNRDRHIFKLTCALARELGLDDEGGDVDHVGSAAPDDGLDIPASLRRDRVP